MEESVDKVDDVEAQDGSLPADLQRPERVSIDVEAQKPRRDSDGSLDAEAEDKPQPENLRFGLMCLGALVLLVLLIWGGCKLLGTKDPDGKPLVATPQSRDAGLEGIDLSHLETDESPWSWKKMGWQYATDCCNVTKWSREMFYIPTLIAMWSYGLCTGSGFGTQTFFKVAASFAVLEIGCRGMASYNRRSMDTIKTEAQKLKSEFLARSGMVQNRDLTTAGKAALPAEISKAQTKLAKGVWGKDRAHKIVEEVFKNLTIFDACDKSSPLRCGTGDVILFYATEQSITTEYAHPWYKRIWKCISNGIKSELVYNVWAGFDAFHLLLDRPEHASVIIEDKGILYNCEMDASEHFRRPTLLKKLEERIPLGYKIAVRRFDWKGDRKELQKLSLDFIAKHKDFKYGIPKIYVEPAVYQKSTTFGGFKNIILQLDELRWFPRGLGQSVKEQATHAFTSDPADNATPLFGGMVKSMSYKDYKSTDGDRSDCFCSEMVARYFDHIGCMPKTTAAVAYTPMAFDGVGKDTIHPIPGAHWDEPLVLTGKGSLTRLELVVDPERLDQKKPDTMQFGNLFQAIRDQQAAALAKSKRL